jgi:hypothetical protein
VTDTFEHYTVKALILLLLLYLPSVLLPLLRCSMAPTCNGTGLGRGANDNTCSGVTAGLQEQKQRQTQLVLSL